MIDNRDRIIRGDARRMPIENNSVQCVVTSLPYWGLRKYAGAQELLWGGEAKCKHEWISDTCQLCTAWHGAFGLEPTIEMYVKHSVEILREIRRVLRPDGVCFWNIGDSYHQGPKGNSGVIRPGDKQGTNAGSLDVRRGEFLSPNRTSHQERLKPKDLCLIPARVAIAAQADGWWVRSDIIWQKPNPMPESVTDRPTDAYEHILMLTKSARYYWDAEAVSEQITDSSRERLGQPRLAQQHGSDRVPGKTNGPTKVVPPRFGGNKYGDSDEPEHRTKSGNEYEIGNGRRNLRNVWTFATQPYKGAHFATFPEKLPRLCIKAASKIGDYILDSFGGSGTTAAVARSLGRKFILVDLAYQDLQQDRIKKGVRSDR